MNFLEKYGEKYRGITREDIVQDLAYYEDKFFCYDDPVPFNGLNLYPATMRDYNAFMSGIECLTLNKNKTIKGLKMTHLEFLLEQMESQDEGQIWSLRFSRLMEIVFHLKNGIKCTECGNIMSFQEYIQAVQEAQKKEDKKIFCPKCQNSKFIEIIKYQTNKKTQKRELVIDGHVINYQEYERMRQFILFQNLPDYRDDSWVDPKIKADHEEKMKIKNKNAGKATIEKKIVCVATKTHFGFQEIYDMTIRKFNMVLYTMDDEITYETNSLAHATGLVSSKDPIDHWIYKQEKDMYGDSYKTLDDVKSDLQKL